MLWSWSLTYERFQVPQIVIVMGSGITGLARSAFNSFVNYQARIGVGYLLRILQYGN